MARLFFFGSLATTVFFYACGTSPVGNNIGADGGSGGKGAAPDGSSNGQDVAGNGSGGSAATGGSGGSGGSATGGAGGNDDPCADCKTLDHCCTLVSLDGCNNAGGCVAASGSQQQTIAARCRTDLNSFIMTLPSQAMSCGATSGGGGMNPDGSARDTNAGGSGGTSGGTSDGGACPAQQPTTTSQGGDLVYQSCSTVDQTCQYRAAFCRCQHAPGMDAGSALVWVCQPII